VGHFLKTSKNVTMPCADMQSSAQLVYCSWCAVG